MYDIIKVLEVLLAAEAHDLFAVDECIDSLKGVKDCYHTGWYHKLNLGRGQGFVMAYDLIK